MKVRLNETLFGNYIAFLQEVELSGLKVDFEFTQDATVDFTILKNKINGFNKLNEKR